MKLQIMIADPAGNTTIFVMTPVNRRHYGEVAQKLLDIKKFNGEQVAFVLPPEEEPEDLAGLPQTEKPDGVMEMSGLEFCGNAARSFGLVLAAEKRLRGRHTFNILASGCEALLEVKIDTAEKAASVKIPGPIACETISQEEFPDAGDCRIVDMGGIVHAVFLNKTPSEKIIADTSEFIVKKYDPAAAGVLFYENGRNFMTPVVFVPGVGTTYYEKSCGSGTVALACVLDADKKDGSYNHRIIQPGGEINALIKKENDTVESVTIDGTVKLGPKITLSV